MNILAVDDELIALKNLELKLKNCKMVDNISLFTSPLAALSWLKENKPDVAFLDIDLGQMDGLELAKRVKDITPNCHIVFITGYEEYAVKAFKLRASGYLLKPVDMEDLQQELDYITKSTTPPQEATSKLKVQCFGNFEVFSKGLPLSFPRQKSKELFAYLINRRGTQATMPEIADILWEDGIYNASRNSQIHSFLHDLVSTLESVGEHDIILRKRNAIAVDVNKISCDFYDCMDGKPAAINSYTGEYMAQYSWAEFVTGKLTMMF